MLLASYPGHVVGERVAWYPLFAHAQPFREKPGNPCTFGNVSRNLVSASSKVRKL